MHSLKEANIHILVQVIQKQLRQNGGGSSLSLKNPNGQDHSSIMAGHVLGAKHSIKIWWCQGI